MPNASTPPDIRISAAAFNLRACHYYQMGERFRTPKDNRALDAYRTAVECFHRFVGLTDLRIEVVEVPFEGKHLPGYFVQAQNAEAERKPCVVFFDGLDVTKEIQFIAGVPDLIKRGISVLVMDGPGTGEAIRFRGMHAAPRLRESRQRLHRLPGAARRRRCEAHRHRRHQPRRLLRAALRRARAALRRLHRLGRDLGLSRRVEAAHRGAIQGLDVGARPSHHVDPRRRHAGRGVAKLEPFRLDGVVQKMRCPFLVVHGADDEQIPLKDAQALYDACGSQDKTLRVFSGEEGGAQHCQRDYLTLGCATMWNWFEDKLVRRA